MNELDSGQKMWVIILALVLFSSVTLVLINQYTRWEQCQDAQPTIKRISQAADSLAGDLIKMEAILDDKDVSLEVKAQLLEEKNIEIGFLQHQVKKMEQEQNMQQEEVQKLKRQLIAARRQLQEAQENFAVQRSMDGLIYRIQIGMLDGSSFPPPPAKPDGFKVEEVDGVQKYIFGSFRTYENALEFRDLYRKLGVEDAWVVPYIDAERVDNQTVLAYQGENQGAK